MNWCSAFINKFIAVAFILFAGVQLSAETMSCHAGQSSYQCLVCNCYHESRGEPHEGKVAVAKTVLSRVQSRSFPNSVCRVVFQPWQFSWTRDKYSNRITTRNYIDRKSLKECREVADQAIDEGPNGLIYFYNPRVVTPAWARRVRACGKAGHHLFMVPQGKPCPERLGANAKSNSYPERKTPIKSKGGRR